MNRIVTLAAAAGTAASFGVWTEEDNITRFEQLEIKALPASEER